MAEEAIAILTSGGDAPGMNAAIATIVRAAQAQLFTKPKREIAVLGIRRGYRGLCGAGDFVSLKPYSVAGILRTSGTVLGSARYPELKDEQVFNDWATKAIELLQRKCVRALVVLGGDGSFRAATKLYSFSKSKNFPIAIVGIPSSIDNDIPGTDFSLGVDTATNTTMRILDSLVGTAYSHGRTFLVETMGARAGYLALMAALVGEAERVFIPEQKLDNGNWRLSLLHDLRDNFKPFRVDKNDPPQLDSQKTQATVVLAEAFDREQEKSLSTPQELQMAVDFQKLASMIRERLETAAVAEKEKISKDQDLLTTSLHSLREPNRTEQFLSLADTYDPDPGSTPQLECRSSIPGHIVRGEPPTARDRILACRLALRAVECIVNCWACDEKSTTMHPDLQYMEEGSGLMIGIRGDTVRPVKLNLFLDRVTVLAGRVNSNREFFFKQPLQIVNTLGGVPKHPANPSGGARIKRLGILTAGADAPGMNATIRAITRVAIDRGLEPWGIRNGFVGLARAGETEERYQWSEEELRDMGLPGCLTRINLRGAINEFYLSKFGNDGKLGTTPEIIELMRTVEDITSVSRTVAAQDVMPWAIREAAYLFPLDWMRVNNIGKLPGSILGSIRSGDFDEKHWNRIARKLQAWEIDGLVVIGGLRQLKLANDFAKATKFPVIGIPATIDNDIPGTYYSIGADTALNTITAAADRVMATAAANYRVFVIDVMGQACGYLAFMGALAGGAEAVLLPEHPFSLGQVHELADHLRNGFRQRRRHGVVICEEKAALEMSPIEVSDAIATAGRGFFETRFVQLGHLQRGGIPTAFDRELGSRMGAFAVDTFLKIGPEDEPQLIAVEPYPLERDEADDLDSEGWQVCSRPLKESIKLRKLDVKPGQQSDDDLETNKVWWNGEQFEDLQHVMMGPPYYADVETKPEERFQHPLAF